MEIFVKTQQGSASHLSPNELTFTQDWSIISKAIERKLSTLSQDLTRSVAGYVVKGSGVVGISSGQIPTAVLLASVNTPDHSALYAQLRELIITAGGIVVLLESDTDVSTARGIIAAIYNQLNSSNELFCSQLEPNSPKRKPSLDLPTSLKSTFLAISLWYDVHVLEHSSRPLATPAASATDENQFGASRKTAVKKVPTNVAANQSVKSLKPLPLRTSNHPTKQKSVATASHHHQKTTPDQRKPTVQRKDATSTTPAAAAAAAPKVSKRLSAKVPNSASGESAKSTALKPLVIVIPAIETISATVLRDFIELAFVYSSACATPQSSSNKENCTLSRQKMFGTIPIRFVFGLSGAADLGLEVRCDATTLSRLAIKRFRTPSPTVFLQAALTEMLHIPGFRMSRSVLNFVIDSIYMCVDYSIENFLKRVKACMISHYQNLQHPQLLKALDISSAYVLSLNHEELTELVSTYPSCAEIAAEAAADSLSDVFTECLKSHWLNQLLVPRILSWLLALFACLEIRPLASTLPDIYRNWLSGDLSTSPAFSQTLSLFKVLNKTRVITAVDSSLGSLMASIGLLSSVKCDTNPTAVRMLSLADVRYKPLLSEAIAIIIQLKEVVASWRARLLEASESVPTEVAADGTSSPISCTPLPGKRLTLQTLREHLKNSPVISKEKDISCGRGITPWKRALDEFAAWLTAVLTPQRPQGSSKMPEDSLACLLPAPHHLPLYEVFYGPPTSEVAALRFRLDPPMQRVVHQVLTNPGAHLKCAELCLMNPEGLDPLLPDLCILYKLHLEAGKLINLYDWLVAFATVVGDPGSSRTLNDKPSQWIQSRFLRGISELEHLGFIRGTRRRVDHVSRLTSTCFLY